MRLGAGMVGERGRDKREAGKGEGWLSSLLSIRGANDGVDVHGECGVAHSVILTEFA